jgi:hypothetical protein
MINNIFLIKIDFFLNKIDRNAMQDRIQTTIYIK